MALRPDEPQEDTQWRTAGDRIQTLVDASAAGGSVARERTEELVRELTDLYGAGLERIMRMAVAANPALAQTFADDDLVASLLLVHGLHPHGIERRVSDALDKVRPYLGSHGGDVHLVEVDGDIIRLQFAGSCKSCPSSAVTLELAVEDAVRAAAPEISSIEVVAAEKAEKDMGSGVISAESLLSRVHADGHRPVAWQPVPALAELADGELGGYSVAGTPALACRIGNEFFAYRDKCASCTGSLAGAVLESVDGTSSLRCPRCNAGYDVVHAGVALDNDADGTVHLDPIPVLVRDGVLSMAMLAQEVAS